MLFELKKNTSNFSPRRIKVTNRVIRQASKCDESIVKRLTFLIKKSFKDSANLKSLISRAK